MIINHDAKTFSAPLNDVTDELRAQLREMGFSDAEIDEGAKAKSISRKFSAGFAQTKKLLGADLEGASEETVQFYRTCQPFGMFFNNLLVALHAFQHGAVASPKQIWSQNRKAASRDQRVNTALAHIAKLLVVTPDEISKIRTALQALAKDSENIATETPPPFLKAQG
jgi:hypothetical protein